MFVNCTIITIAHTQIYMKLTKAVIKKLDTTRRLKLAIALGFSEQWINRLVDTNKNNGPLTTIKALQLIREETGLTDAEILEESTEKERA